MPPETIQTIAAYIAIGVPATVAIANLARIGLEWLKQHHLIRASQVEQSHSITTHYLDRALDPSVPLAIRHQLLRFLATPDKSGSRLSTWAARELDRVDGIVEGANRELTSAEAEMNNAKTAAEIANAERKLAEALRRQKSLFEPPVSPPVTAAALRAGVVKEKELKGLAMRNEYLQGAELLYKDLRGADFENANLEDANFQGSDLRAASFTGADLTEASFYEADLRGAVLRDAMVTKTRFAKARLEGADLRVKSIETADLFATYDQSTLWPDCFDPVAAGCVLIADESGTPAKLSEPGPADAHMG